MNCGGKKSAVLPANQSNSLEAWKQESNQFVYLASEAPHGKADVKSLEKEILKNLPAGSSLLTL